MSNGGRSGLRLVGGGFVAGGNSGRRRVKDECGVRRAPHWLASSFLCGSASAGTSQGVSDSGLKFVRMWAVRTNGRCCVGIYSVCGYFS